MFVSSQNQFSLKVVPSEPYLQSRTYESDSPCRTLRDDRKRGCLADSVQAFGGTLISADAVSAHGESTRASGWA